jgi:hypothetical protein
MGILVPAGALLMLALLPFGLDRQTRGVGVWFNREGRVAQIIVLALLASIVGLILRGALT